MEWIRASSKGVFFAEFLAPSEPLSCGNVARSFFGEQPLVAALTLLSHSGATFLMDRFLCARTHAGWQPDLGCGRRSHRHQPARQPDPQLRLA